MKNLHKLQGKREFLFDDRELIALGVGALFICILIFVLGFLLGKDLQEKSIASPLVSENMKVQEEAAPVERALPNTPVAENKSQEPSAPTKKSQTGYYKVLPDSETYVEVAATPTKKPEIPAPGTEKTQPSKSIAEIPQQPQPAVKGDPQKPLSATVPASTAAPAQEAVIAPALPNVPKGPNDAVAFGRQTPLTPKAQEGTALSPKGYSVQVASSTSKRDSEQLQQKYMGLGYDAYIMTADLGEKGIWYRVLVGNCATKEEAEQIRREITQKASNLAKNPYVIKVTE